MHHQAFILMLEQKPWLRQREIWMHGRRHSLHCWLEATKLRNMSSLCQENHFVTMEFNHFPSSDLHLQHVSFRFQNLRSCYVEEEKTSFHSWTRVGFTRGARARGILETVYLSL